MNTKYKNILNNLIKSYYEGDFDKTLDEIMMNSSYTQDDIKKIISSLCGVHIKEDGDFKYNLKKAITNYSVNCKLVEKLKDCSSNCSHNNSESPCQASCPFDAISKDPITNNTFINTNLCNDCGICVNVCESGNFLDKIELIPLLELLKNNEKVIAIVAPAIIGQFGNDVTMDQLRTSFIKLGFTDMIEVAFAADMLTLNEAVEFNHHVHSRDDLLITSCCCPVWIGMIKKVYYDLVKDISPSVSPMIAASRIIKFLNEDAKVVFIGPCIAKKAEAREKDLIGSVDLVLTFEELKGLFETLNINPSELNATPSVEYTSKGGRLYAREGGVTLAVKEAVDELFPDKGKLFKGVNASGVKDCKELLTRIQDKNIDANFVEGMGCPGGCAGGPKRLIPTEEGIKAVNSFAYSSPIKIATHSDILDELFKKLDIHSLEDLNDPEKTKIFHRTF